MTIKSKLNTAEFESEYERIFGNKKPERGSWTYDPVQRKLVPKDEYHPAASGAPAIHGSIEAFTSPIDGTVIDDRAKLRAHNARHGVTNINDYGENNGKAWFERKHKERSAILRGDTQRAKQERIETIKRAIERHENR